MALNAQGLAALETLEVLMKTSVSKDAAVNTLRIMLNNDGLVEDVLTERDLIIKQRLADAHGVTVFDEESETEPWYAGPQPHDVFWPSLKAKLQADPGWTNAVPSLDKTSTDVVSLLADPHSETIRTRGMVLGYVQSGKTANFTATIAKAADAGYRLFIVLSGVHNSLRRQTQLRLDSQLCDLRPADWVQLTDEFGDFGNPVKALPLVAGSQLRLLAVVKKNVSRLTNLRDWLLDAHEKGGLNKCPVLIIDDEADQASPNSARDAELDQTAINGLLVDLLGLPRVAYVGYTATPFANVLANPADPQNIYPRDFIYSLPKPAGYFGSEELFGAAVAEPEESSEDQGHDMIRFVPDAEAEAYKSSSKSPYSPKVTPSLSDAIRWFLLATAARRFRNGEAKHSSMLIHTTMRVEPQNTLVPVIRKHVKDLQKELQSGDTSKWQNQWESEVQREPAARHNLVAPSFEELLGLLPDVLTDTKVVADNSASPERLIYAADPATVIAVGGNTLSRGLTLEGLVSSFFLRTAGAYDSALQMGRWFGYRRGYEDLPRVWTTRKLKDDFQFLAEIESDLRSEIKRYEGGAASPRDVAVRIQTHPRMQVTSPLKMQFAIKASASFSETHPQTTYFDRTNSEILVGNIEATKELLSAAKDNALDKPIYGERTLFKGVPAESILRFLDHYHFNDKSEMSEGMLLDYVTTQLKFGALREWNIAVVSKSGQSDRSAETLDLGLEQRVNLITRSQLNSSEPDVANIGTLMSRVDRVLDLGWTASQAKAASDAQLQEVRNAEGRPLLVVYPIDKDSAPQPHLKSRKELNAAEHMVGLAFSFPAAAPGSEPKNSIQVDVSMLNTDEADDSLNAYVDAEGSHDKVALG